MTAESGGNSEPLRPVAVNYRQPSWSTFSNHSVLSVAYLTEPFLPQVQYKQIALRPPSPLSATAEDKSAQLNRLRAGGEDRRGGTQTTRSVLCALLRAEGRVPPLGSSEIWLQLTQLADRGVKSFFGKLLNMDET